MMSKLTAVFFTLLVVDGCARRETPGNESASSSAAMSATVEASAAPSTARSAASPAAPSPLTPGAGSASPSSAPPSAGLSPKRLSELCHSVCSHVQELHCKDNSSCDRTCAESFSLPMCGDKFEAFLLCSGKQPLKNWECSDEGVAALKDGNCDAEQGAILKCIREQ